MQLRHEECNDSDREECNSDQGHEECSTVELGGDAVSAHEECKDHEECTRSDCEECNLDHEECSADHEECNSDREGRGECSEDEFGGGLTVSDRVCFLYSALQGGHS